MHTIYRCGYFKDKFFSSGGLSCFPEFYLHQIYGKFPVAESKFRLAVKVMSLKLILLLVDGIEPFLMRNSLFSNSYPLRVILDKSLSENY